MLSERSWAKKIHILGFNLHKNLENTNQSTVTASNPWFFVKGCEVGGGIPKGEEMSGDNGYVYCYDYDYGSLSVYI